MQHILSLTMVLFNGIKDCYLNILEFSYGERKLLKPPQGGGSENLIFTNLINIVRLEKFHHKPMEMYIGGVIHILY